MCYCLSEQERAEMHNKSNPLHTLIIENEAYKNILNSKIKNPQTSNTEKTLRLFLKVYYAILSMASFKFGRSNQWEHLNRNSLFMNQEEATKNLKQLEEYQRKNPRSRTSHSMSLATQSILLKDQLATTSIAVSENQKEPPKETPLSPKNNDNCFLSENGLVIEVIKAGFKKAPFYSSVNVDGQTFFRSASLAKHFRNRQPDTPLTGRTVETVRRALGITQ